jgi:hypothetical protein
MWAVCEATIMVLDGHVEKGVVVFDQAVALPEGLPVRVEVPEDLPGKSSEGQGETAGQRLLKFAGKAVGLPPDAARNHDHYLYGATKR